MHSRHAGSATRCDLLLVGGGIASATLAALMSELEPSWKVVVVEKLDRVGKESSEAWNNAGTGHSALCELNYTPEVDGRIDISKALAINEQFQTSRELWAALVREGALPNPECFIRSSPHMSFVRGEENVRYLHMRVEELRAHALFEEMEFSTDPERIREWAPLTMRGRGPESVAASFSAHGTDIDFGTLTELLFRHAQGVNTELRTAHTVKGLERTGDTWRVRAVSGQSQVLFEAPRVFVGAGGGALPLLQMTKIPEIRGYGGFPISGQWLRCTNEEEIEQHAAKVYGKAAVGAPPMSVPHLDTRIIDGKRELMFGPYAGWSPKFLKEGSPLDLPRSVRPGNVAQMLAVVGPNLDLMGYLAHELMATKKARMESLREFMPTARDEDWELLTAGQRVQVIAPHEKKVGVLQFGTELIVSADGSMSGMLGASPGASTATSIMLTLLEKAYAEHMPRWNDRLSELIPTRGISLVQNPEAARQSIARTSRDLGLTTIHTVKEH